MARFRSWWQQIKQHRVTILVVAIILIVAVALIIVGYRFDWTGFNGNSKSGKTLWDWLQLLIIPTVLAIGGYLFSFTTSRNERKAADRHNQTEREIAQDNQHGATLQEYVNKMSELLLHEKLRESQPEDEVRKIARVLTLTVLPILDIHRKRIVIQFIYEAGLIEEGKSIIDLSGADLVKAYLGGLDLTGANLSRTMLMHAELMGVHLVGANLSEVNLCGANLLSADLTGANIKAACISLKNYAGMEPINTNLFNANLAGANLNSALLCSADLRDANLIGADLTGADLSGAKITEEQLAKVKSLQGATMPDRSKHS